LLNTSLQEHIMRSKHAFALTLVSMLMAPAAGAQSSEHRPGHSTQPAPQAADQTRGMALMSAAVYWDGTLLRGAGAIAAQRNNTGTYQVDFARSIVNCTITVSVSSPTEDEFYIGFASAGRTAAASNRAWVWTFLNTGGQADRPFTMMVFCVR
jgi:hypothetical protein